MLQTIWKYAVPPMFSTFDLELPAGAKVLAVQLQDGRPQIWAQVDPGNLSVTRHFWSFGTGHGLPDDIDEKQYVGTYQDLGLVWHVYVDREGA